MHLNAMHTWLAALALSTATLTSIAQAPLPPDKEILSKAYSGKVYSPYAKREFPGNVYFGDTHLHTNSSMEAGAFGNRLGLEAAYRFARGEEVDSTRGGPARLSRPLDFLVVADHSDNLGFFPDLVDGAPHIVSDPTGKDWYNRIRGGKHVEVALEISGLLSQNQFPAALAYAPDSPTFKNAWGRSVKAADKYNEPGRFTAFIGYEWGALADGDNLHRVVVYRDGGDKGSQVLPLTTLAPHGSTDPLKLWAWMAQYKRKTGGDVLSIAHSGNLSNGSMFPLDAQGDGKPLDARYAQERDKWEPLYEVTQIMGDGETHPLLSPNDEFANFEIWDIASLAAADTTDATLAGGYAREGLKRGLQLQTKLGINPYKFGMIGSTGSHTSLSTAEEDNFFGKHAGAEPSKERMVQPFMAMEKGSVMGWQMAASGLTAVWATENTRAALFDAMKRREVYATTGPRIAVRLFGGWEFNRADLDSREPAFVGYAKGVPMGADLPENTSANVAPSFMVFAQRDAIGANLDRIQIVKGWFDGEKTHEKVYDVSWSGDRKPGADGKLPPVGNTVDAKTASWKNTIGAPELATVWTDPEFNPRLRAFYYARVLEIPKPRWSTYDSFRFGAPIPEGAPASIQDRAYTSAIWYNP